MFPFCDSPNPMDIPLYQQLQLSPPSSPKPDHQSWFYYHSSPSFAADAFHHSYIGAAAAAAAATPPSAEIGSPPELVVMDQAPAPNVDAANARGGPGGGHERAEAAAAASKDRHSKICTAGGMRDRRMRLSLDVARKFFALQDMLGFDKASKTVQWLLNMSKGAIREVMTDEGSSECEEDGSSSLSVVDGKQKPPAEEHKGDPGEGKKPSRARKAATNPKPSRKLANAHPIPDKESRAKARERARERTREKNRMRWVTLASTINLETATTTAAAAAAADELIMSPNTLNHSSSMNAVNAVELEERCSSSTLHANGGRMQETSMATEASDVILGFGNGGYGGGSNYYQGQQWELGGVVFANSRLY